MFQHQIIIKCIVFIKFMKDKNNKNYISDFIRNYHKQIQYFVYGEKENWSTEIEEQFVINK